MDVAFAFDEDFSEFVLTHDLGIDVLGYHLVVGGLPAELNRSVTVDARQWFNGGERGHRV